MKIGLATRTQRNWTSNELIEAMKKRDVEPLCIQLPSLTARVGHSPIASTSGTDILKELSALIVRPIGRGSLEEILFRMDLLYRLERKGLYIVNPPKSIERAVDKYYALSLLEEANIPVPRTIVTESPREALKAFRELGGDVVLKPITGSRGIGSTRITDVDVAERIFRALSIHHGVFYLQEFISHGFSDVRAFVLGNTVLASMRRVAEGWKTNVSQGATPVSIELDEEQRELAVKSAETVGCPVAGVDILESSQGPKILEVNSQPGWKGLQTVTTVRIAEEIVGYVISQVKK